MNINSRTSKVNFTGYASGSIASFTGLRAAPIKVAAQIVPIQSGSGTPSPDNIRPIIGASECNVVRCGKNVLPTINKNTTDFTMDSNGYYTQNNPSSASWAWAYSKRLAQATLPAGDYICSFYASTLATSNNSEMRIYTSSGTELGRVNGKNLTTTSITFTLTQETTIGVIAKIYDGKWAFQIENGSTASSSFEAYNGNTYIIQLGDTYYGGSLNVTNGVLTVTDAKVDMGTLEWNKTSASQYNLFRAPIPNIKEAEDYTTVMSLYCEIYKTVAPDDRTNHTVYVQVNQGHSVDVIDNDCNDVVELKNRLNGVKLVYPLATPVNIQLTPTQINQIIGTNNIFSDSGNVEVFFVTI